MGHQIIRQPNGKYCIWSTIVQNIIYCNCTPEDIVNINVKAYKKEQQKQVKEICRKLDNNDKPYYQFTMSFREMLEKVKNQHGEKELRTLAHEMGIFKLAKKTNVKKGIRV